MDVLLAIGTRKGLWLARSSDRRSWRVSGPQFPVTEVKAFAIDTRGSSPRLLAAVLNEHFGLTVVSSDDLGETWNEPEQAPIAFPEDTGAALEAVWQLTPGPGDQPDVVYAGTEPSALFRSSDGGKSFELVRGLWDHPHRPNWFPGGGGQAVHTVLPHPEDENSMIVAMSTGGVYRTADGGATWNPANRGVRADFMPDEYPEYGQCVHKVAMHPSNPDELFLQNHGGVYRSRDAGGSWESIEGGLPENFGFSMVVHPHRPGVIYNFPLTSPMNRFPPKGQCGVYRSEDGGGSWTQLRNGLPEEGFWSAVMRDAMCADDADPAGIYFGSRSGEVYASADEGEHWQQVAAHLPDVFCVRAAVI
jgi:photosystem II stability/assembly factor-like uncharacterized protein